MTFWRYVCAALDKIVGGIAEDTEYVRASSEMVKAHIHLNILIDRLAEAPTDFLLVLDDLHEISEPSILKGLSYLMDYLPAKMHLILISRREPELDLARQRIKWQAQRLGEQDLRFQEEEISRFYQARGYSLPEEELKKVESYTEGWAAAMVAVAMSMEHAGGGNALAALPQSSRASSLLKQMPGSLLPTSEAGDQVAGGKAGKVLEQLTVQERKVLELMANAATNQQISETLGISLRTVKTHTGNIYGKLGLKNRSQCLKLVLELGIL